MDFGASFVVLDNNNKTIYKYNFTEGNSVSGNNTNIKSLEDAIQKRYPYRYISVSQNIVGTVVMLDDTEREAKALQKKLLIALIAAGVIIMIGEVGFGMYVKKSIIEPFDQMKDFAGRVAMGNLNEPLMMDKENMFGSFTESFDIMREELAESRKRELELQRKEKELVASLSHDLKTPITGIKLTTELLKAKVDNNIYDDINGKLDNIYKKADQIDVLVSDLFSTTLEDLGEFKVNCDDEESLIISDIIRKVDDKGLVRESDIPKVIINIDKHRMNQVIGNIISNSYKYSGTEIDVDYKLIDGYIEMKFRDYGPGVPKDELELITNKFYRGKDSVKSGKEGSGLGLYISKMLMEKMDGELTCENAVEADKDHDARGLVVTLLIPMG